MSERGNSILRMADKWLGIPLIAPAVLYRKIFRPKPAATCKRIGILCLGAIGDMLLLSALLQGIRSKEPEAHICLIGTNANRQALPLMRNVDNCHYEPLRNLSALCAYIRRSRFDVLIDASQWARIGALICAFSQAKVTAGFQTAGQFRSLPYDITVEHSASMHELDNFLALGKAVWPGLTGSPRLNLPEWQTKERIIYCHMWPAPGKGRHLKQWPDDKWAELIQKLVERGFEICLTGAGNDKQGNDKFISDYFAAEEKVHSIAGKVDLKELGVKFTRACAVISVNTGIMHLAALSGTPTIGLHGATNPERWGPIGSRCKALLPQKGECAYLNLGFEYPDNVQPSMQYLEVGQVMQSLAQFGVI